MKVGILGAGSWGTTLAIVLNENRHDVTLWSFEHDDAGLIQSARYNKRYLPGIYVPDAISITTEIADAVSDMDIIVLATPSQFMRSILEPLNMARTGTPILVNVAKGIENKTLMRMSEVVKDTIPEYPCERYAVLSGPSHAEEVSQKKATTVVVASPESETSKAVQDIFATPYFRIYSSKDVLGVELGGSLKNVIAIGAGICDGGGYGDNTKAALITRGIEEMRRLGLALGATQQTFSGLSGLGDLIVTTMSKHSRNRFVGEQIGMGKSLDQILKEMNMVAEGVETTRSAYELSQKHGIDMPITREMYNILFNNKDPLVATHELMTRVPKNESWS